MKIFITGVTGFLGRHVARKCAKQGHEVIALVRNTKINNTMFDFNLIICHGHLTDLESYNDSIKEVDVIIHCGSDTSLGAFKNKSQEETNVKGTQNLIFSAKKHNVERFIYISSSNTIKHGDFQNPGIENIKVLEKKSNLSYINTKIKAEKILLSEFKNNKFPVIILNPSFILGPEDYKPSSGILIYTAMHKRMLLCPTGGKNIVDVRDVTDAVYSAIKNGKLGENYLLSNSNLTYLEIFKLTAKYANIPLPKPKLPSFLIYIIGFLGSFSELITNKISIINHKTVRLLFENHYYIPDKAKNELSFKARPVNTTIKDTVDWFKNG